MQAKREDLEQLLEIQKADLALIRVRKQIDDLPQRSQIAKLKAKRQDLEAKRDKVDELQHKAQTDFKKLETEDIMLADKQKHVQELIQNTGTDYRSVESHSREMDGFAKRRKSLGEQLEKLALENDKIEKLQEQFVAALDLIEADEKKAQAAFDEQSGKLQEQVDVLRATRDEQAARVPAELVARYEETAKRCAGVGIGRLEDNRCGVCRSAIDGGRLIELRAQAPLGTCPACHRLLVIDEGQR